MSERSFTAEDLANDIGRLFLKGTSRRTLED